MEWWRKVLGSMFFGLLNLVMAFMYGGMVFGILIIFFDIHNVSRYWGLIPAIPVACYFAGVLLIDLILED